jgi:hypothetical protein
MTIGEKLARLRELYPDDIDKIELEEQRVHELLQAQEFYNQPTTQQLLALCRKDILTARVKLATERALDERARAELWHIIDAREWFVRMVAKDYESELLVIEQQLEADLNG